MIRAIQIQNQITRNFEQEITEEKDSGAPAVKIGAESEILVHRQRCDGNIAAIDISDAVSDSDQGQEPPGNLCDRPAFDCLRYIRSRHEIPPVSRSVSKRDRFLTRLLRACEGPS
jgi:hypothetical protein